MEPPPAQAIDTSTKSFKVEEDEKERLPDKQRDPSTQTWKQQTPPRQNKREKVMESPFAQAKTLPPRSSRQKEGGMENVSNEWCSCCCNCIVSFSFWKECCSCCCECTKDCLDSCSCCCECTKDCLYNLICILNPFTICLTLWKRCCSCCCECTQGCLDCLCC